MESGWRRDPGKSSLDVSAIRLFPGRQLQLLTKSFERFVHEKSWRHGRNLEQYAARLTEIDGREVLPIEDLRHLQPASHQLFTNGELIAGSRDRKRDMVHGAQAV